MKGKFRKLQALIPAACLVTVFLMAGCAGPSTRVLPRENHGGYFEALEESSLLEEANPFYIQETLGILTASHRLSGSSGETEAARMLEQYLQDYGYEVSRQRFRLWDGGMSNEVTGTNVVAIRKALIDDADQADIMIIGTHHDTADLSPGANNNASGVVTWLETARLVAHIPTDTEIRFVSFAGFEDGWLGSQYYVDSLPKEEKDRVIGAVQLEAFGSVEFPELVLGTSSGYATVLGDMIKQSFWNVTGETLQYEIRDSGDHMSFVSGQIPAVTLTQKRSPYEMDTPLDLETTVDVERITRVTDCVTNMVAEVMSAETPSLLAKSRHMNQLRDGAYVHRKGQLLGFGQEQRVLEPRMRQEGVLISSTEEQNGTILEGYQYQMKWFDVDQIILTNYYYADGRLDSVTLDADGAGVDLEDMMERLHSWYGDPDEEGSGPNGAMYVWKEPVLNMAVHLSETGDGYELEMREYHSGAQILGTYQTDGTPVSEAAEDEARVQIFFRKWEKLCPKNLMDHIKMITFYTDGIGETKGYVEVDPDAQEEDAAPVIFIDLEDMLNEYGIWRDETEAEKRILKLIGEVLRLDGADGAADLFYAEFPAQTDNEVQTDLRPGEAESISTRLPDFAESFMYYVLSCKNDDRPGEWSERIRFFDRFKRLESYRQEIRKALKLHSDPEF